MKRLYSPILKRWQMCSLKYSRVNVGGFSTVYTPGDLLLLFSMYVDSKLNGGGV
jgi:hypothetical protein